MAERARTGRRSLSDGERGVSEVLSYVFVFTLILTSIGIVSIAGLGSLDEVRTAEQAGNAEKAFDVLHDNMADLYVERAPSRAAEIDLGGSELFFGESVTVNVTVVEGGDSTVAEFETRPVVQRLEDERRLVYEAGAVFRTQRDGGIVVDDPPLTFRSRTVHATALALRPTSNRSIGGGSVLVRGEVTKTTVTSRDTDGNTDRVVVTVTSPRYEYWESYLSEQPGVACTTDPAANRVECTRDSNLESVYVVVHEGDLSLIN